MAKTKPSLAELSRLRKEAKNEKGVKSEDNQKKNNSEPQKSSKTEPLPKQIESTEEERKKVGRPKSIRSNPDYESTTIRIHKKVKAQARFILSTQQEKMDLQTLINRLLEDFVEKNKASLL